MDLKNEWILLTFTQVHSNKTRYGINVF